VVNIAVPQKDVFSDETDKTTASVLLSLKPGVVLSNDQVQAITNLIAGSVAGLTSDNVTITDQSGMLLSSPDGSAGSAAGSANRADQQTALYENRLSKAVQQVLDPLVGVGHSVVRVNAELDYSSHDIVSEKYTAPSPTVPPQRQATVKEQYSGSGTTGGALGQVTPSALSSASGGAYSREQNTVENPVDKTVERSQTAPGGVQRLTVAVVLDSAKAATLNTGQIQTLVANSVGLNATRGDTVQVSTLPFDTTAAKASTAALTAAAKAAKTAQYVDLGKKVGIGLLVLVALIIAMRRRKASGAIEGTASDLPTSGLVLPGRAAIGAATAAISASAGSSPAAALDAGDPNRDRVRKDVSELVDSQPEEVAQMLQSWLGERGR
jgi:flagellar M-ring protein FliF